ncbi:hypothetical protein ACJJTC_004898 [Scirpophaga incertulas]
MQRTPDKNIVSYGSEPNIAAVKNKVACLDRWVEVRQKKRRIDDEVDSDSSVQNGEIIPPQYYLADMNKKMALFFQQMDSMRELITSIKDDQNNRFTQLHNDMTDIKSQIYDIKKNSEEIEKSVDYLGTKCQELEKARQEMKDESRKQSNRITDLMNKNIYLEKCNRSLEEHTNFYWLQILAPSSHIPITIEVIRIFT